jgi:DNA-binding beta-propeller fold protein YncE
MNQDSDDASAKNLAPRPQNKLSPGQGDRHGQDSLKQDVIITGDIYGGYVAIGRGAQVIVQHVLSAAEEAEQSHQIETRILAQAVAGYVESFRSQLPQAETSVGQAEPYKSLLPYRLADAPLFFGRDQATIELLNSTSRGRLTVLHAESGAGKTSLLQAGLGAHLLAQGHLPIYVRAWRHSPSLAIKQTLLPNLGRTPQLAQLPLRAFLRQVTEVLGLVTVVYILLDQFEEFFIRLPDEDTREEFIEELGQCVEDETLPVRFVLSLRKDYFANLSDFRGRLPYIFANEYPLKLFSRAEAASAITAPANLVGLTYAPDVVDHILDELQANEQKVIMPAQLQLVCWALYRSLDYEQRLITPDKLQQMEDVAGILRNYLRRVIAQEIPAGQRVAAQRILETLVRSDRTGDIQTTAQLARQFDSVEMLPPVLAALVSSRLLRVVETGPEAEAAYELAHDYLIEQIELDPEVLARKAAQELLDQEVAAWQQNPLLRIGEEKLKIIQAQESKIHFSPAAIELYELSKKARRRRRRILFGLIGSVILALGIASLLGISYVIAENNLGIARNSLVTATSVIQSAQDAAAEAENKQVTAVWAANIAQNSQVTAMWAASMAENRQATAVSARQTAETDQQAAIEAEQAALAAGYAAQTRQAEAEQNEAAAIMGQATAEAARQQAIQAEQTAQAGQQIALQAQQTAQAQQAIAEQAGQQAQAAAAAAQQAQAVAEAARQEAERAQRRAEEEAAQARREREQAEQAAQNAEATRVAVEALRDQAERELQETQRIAAIIRDTKDCRVGGKPDALAFDGAHIWVTNQDSDTIHKLRATDCGLLGEFPTGRLPEDVVYGGGYIWVADFQDNTVRKLAIFSGTTIATFVAGPPGSQPTSLLHDGTALWVASWGSNKIRKINPDSGADLGTYDTGNAPVDLAYDGTNIWIANFLSNTVSRINATTGAPQGVFPVGFRPIWLAYDKSQIWVANRDSDTLTKLRASDGALLNTFNTGNVPDALAFDGLNIWSANQADNTVTRLQPVDGTLLSTIPTARTPTAMLFDGANLWVVAEDDDLVQKIPITINLVGQEPLALAYDGLYIWVANQADHTVSKMLASTGERLATFGVGQRPVALANVGATIWVANRSNNTVSKLRAADGANLGNFAVGDAPNALTSDGPNVWVANYESGNVTRLRGSDGVNTGTFPVGSRPIDILYDGSHIWVANEGDQTLRQLNPDGSLAKTYNLGITPASFLFDGTYFWVGYVFDAPGGGETGLRQIRATDGVLISDIPTGMPTDPEIAPASVVYDGTYVWVSSPSNIFTDTVTRLERTNPVNMVNFPVCDGPSALLFTSSVWVACKDDNLIQKLPDDMGLSGFSASSAGFSAGILKYYLPLILKQ